MSGVCYPGVNIATMSLYLGSESPVKSPRCGVVTETVVLQ